MQSEEKALNYVMMKKVEENLDTEMIFRLIILL